jgi:hypothetical protein
MSTIGTTPTPTVQPVSDQPVTTAEETNPRRSSLVTAVVGVAIGLALAGLAIWVTGRDTEDAVSSSPPPTVAPPQFDPVDLVVAYGRSRTENHALVGELRRGEQTPLPVRRALLDDRAIDEVGATAVVTEAGETRQCELIEGQWLCAPPLPALSSELDVQSFATLLLTEAPPYQIFAVSPVPPSGLSSITSLGAVTCWSMVSDGRRDRARFGAESTLCFHDELGTLIGQETETSAGSDVFLATELRSDVTIADVEPSR